MKKELLDIVSKQAELSYNRYVVRLNSPFKSKKKLKNLFWHVIDCNEGDETVGLEGPTIFKSKNKEDATKYRFELIAEEVICSFLENCGKV